MKKRGGYGVVYQDVTRNSNLPAATKGLYAYLSSFCGTTDECYPSVETITKEMDMGKDTFYRHINALVAAGVVEKHQTLNNGKFGRTIYRLTHEVTILDYPVTDNGETEKSYYPITDNRDTDSSTTSSKETNNNITNNNNIKNNIEYQLIADMYNDTCVSYPKLTKLSDRRKKAIKARFNQGYSVQDFKRLFEMAEGSSFLKGGNNRNWSANFDWLVADENMAKVLDGNYQDRQNKGGGGSLGNGSQGWGKAADFYEQFLGTGDSDQGGGDQNGDTQRADGLSPV